jgi:hypothetical protein
MIKTKIQALISKITSEAELTTDIISDIYHQLDCIGEYDDKERLLTLLTEIYEREDSQAINLFEYMLGCSFVEWLEDYELSNTFDEDD